MCYMNFISDLKYSHHKIKNMHFVNFFLRRDISYSSIDMGKEMEKSWM